MTCEYSIKIHCDAVGCRECFNVFLLQDKHYKIGSTTFLYSEAAKKGWTNIEDHDYCPIHSQYFCDALRTKMDIACCPHCKKDSVVISGASTDSCYTLCTCCGMRGPREGSTAEAIANWNNFCERSK
jgi:hypothetical protein